MASSAIRTVLVQSQAQTVSIRDEQDEVFNYELVHLRYLEACEGYFNMNSITGPWTKKARDYIISSIKAKSIVLSLRSLEYDLEPWILEKYQIVLEDGEEKLVLTGTAIEVLPYEECFDIFVELHGSTGHGDFEIISNQMKGAFLVNNECLKIFLLHCNVCKKNSLKKIQPTVFNDCVSIEILKPPIQDLDCRFILFYIDSVTNYMLLRPLIAMDVHEISIEMLKIFTEFGPPVVIKTIHAPLFNDVLTILARGGFNYDISIHENDRVISESYDLMQKIVARTNENDYYWSTICRFIQFQHNNGVLPIHDPILNTVNATVQPYQQLFMTKHSSNKDGEPEKHTLIQNNEDTCSISDTLANVGNVVEERVIKSEISDTTSEEKKIAATDDTETEENLNSNKDQSENVLNDSVEMNKQKSYNLTMDDMDNISSNEIKIEYNPIEPSSHLRKSGQNCTVSEIQDANNVPSTSGTPLIIDSIPEKEEPALQEYLILNDFGNTPNVIPIAREETNPNTTIPHKFYVGILRNSNKKAQMKDNKNDRCSVCDGKMLTDFFCFGCKKKTHIFCLNRVTSPLKKITHTVISFTYCSLCLKAKYNIKNSANIIK